jgi:Pre-mRNA splicing Prp18-interacting factor
VEARCSGCHAQLLSLSRLGFAKLEKRVRTTGGGSSGSVRNLRIREDTAKYLLNLDPNSAHYDPKSRSMREDPNPDKDPALKTFTGDNFVRKTGDYYGWEALNLHSYTAYEKGQDIHVQGVPSQVGSTVGNAALGTLLSSRAGFVLESCRSGCLEVVRSPALAYHAVLQRAGGSSLQVVQGEEGEACEQDDAERGGALRRCRCPRCRHGAAAGPDGALC